jgi:hypothetical protein
MFITVPSGLTESGSLIPLRFLVAEMAFGRSNYLIRFVAFSAIKIISSRLALEIASQLLFPVGFH